MDEAQKADSLNEVMNGLAQFGFKRVPDLDKDDRMVWNAGEIFAVYLKSEDAWMITHSVNGKEKHVGPKKSALKDAIYGFFVLLSHDVGFDFTKLLG